MSKRIFILRNEDIRRRCQAEVWDADDNSRVVISDEAKSRDQEENLYAYTVPQVKMGEPVKLLQSDTGSNQTTSLKGHHG